MTLQPIMLAVQFSLFLCLTCGDAIAARYVPVKVTLNGKVVLEGNASDDGTRDADAVWEALKTVNLGETEAFQRLAIASDIKEHKLGGDEKDPDRLPIRIDVAYGGVATPHTLTIRRMPPDPAGRTWRIASDDVDDLFDSRMVSRRDVAGLTNHKLEKWKTKTKKK